MQIFLRNLNHSFFEARNADTAIFSALFGGREQNTKNFFQLRLSATSQQR